MPPRRCEENQHEQPEQGGERKFKVVGTRPIRHDGLDKVTGRANYGADLSLPGMLHGVILRSPHAHARIKKIDVSKALAMPGRQGDRDRRRLPGDRERRDGGRREPHRSEGSAGEHHGPGQGPLSRPCDRGRRRFDGRAGSRSLQDDRGRLRSPRARAEPRARARQGRADPARGPQGRRRAAAAGGRHQHHDAARECPGRRRRRVQERGRDRRGLVRGEHGPPGLHRAARHRRDDPRERAGRRLVLDPGPVRGEVDDRRSRCRSIRT